MLFDEPYYIEINEARWAAAARLLEALRPLDLRSAYDLGCGPGWFAARLAQECGFDVLGLDARAENVAEAARRVPQAAFDVLDFDAAPLDGHPPRDLAFCFGLLYHLENPFLAVRRMARLTGRILLLETMLIPRPEPVAWLVDEGRNETQGATYNALIPTRGALTKMLAVAGFDHVYEVGFSIRHADFVDTPERHPRRGMFVCAREPLTLSDCARIAPAATPKYDFAKR